MVLLCSAMLVLMDDKLVLVFIPGLLCDERVWAQQIAELRGAYSCCVSIFTADDTVDSFVKKTLALSEGPLVIVGHSMGGRLALEIALQSARVHGLCLINTTIDNDSSGKCASRMQMIEQYQQNDFAPIINFPKRCTLQPSKAVEDMMLENKALLLNQQKFLLARKDNRDQLINIKCPTLIIHSEQDEVKDITQAERMVAALANSKLQIIENSGHMAPMEQPAVVTKSLREWLESLS